ncbi:MAG: toprim domain-containing protein, partial [Burkholderiales bacterium]
MNEAVEQFRDAIRSAGLEPPEVIESDGALHRFASNGKRRDDAGWYVLHPDGIPAGSFGDWRTGHSETWRADIGRGLTPQEEAAYRSRVEAMRREREAEDAKVKAEARKRAAAIWQAATAAPENHPYLVKKRTKPHGLRVHDGALVVPIRDGANTQSLQFIGADGEKRFLTGGRVRGCYYQIGTPNGVICIVEGFATGASVHEATGHAVAIAFNAGNLLSVAQEMRSRFPDAKLVICADDDSKTPGNPGITKATEAARAVGGLLAVPDFGPDRPEGATDMNDLARIHGTEAVRRVVEDAVATVATVAVASPAEPLGAHGWPEPQPLAAKIEPQPYPIDALPDTIRAAVEEVGGFVKAPLPLVASSALAALSLAAQAHIDIKRADRLQGPTGLYLLTIADSGER